MRACSFTCILVVVAASASAQTLTPPPYADRVDLSGPRFGVTLLSDDALDELRLNEIELRPTISQFGWQFEKAFYATDTGVAALNEWVVLFGGLDQGVALPSVSWLVGLRTAEGTEFGVGPNLSAGGVALALAAGVTLRAGVMNVPMNVAVVPAKTGLRISFLTGFNLRR